ncbi:MAG: hypothetical protein ACRES5_05690 [Pseudomonas sp.]|uniref:hypothetical protein n=1 Tax=Stenotrophomonas sp. TaxID=69392 RepID=UPI003D6C7019
MESKLIALLRSNADLSFTKLMLREDLSTTDSVAEIRSKEAIAAVEQAIGALELAETMLTVFGVEGEKLERIRAAIARVDGVL